MLQFNSNDHISFADLKHKTNIPPRELDKCCRVFLKIKLVSISPPLGDKDKMTETHEIILNTEFNSPKKRLALNIKKFEPEKIAP